MNETAVLLSIKELIQLNSATLTQDLVHQNVRRSLAQIATSNLTPPNQYYYVLIYVTDAREGSKPTKSRTTQRPTRNAYYDIQIEISDQAMVQIGEDQPYDTLHNDFRRLCDRTVHLIEQQNFIGTSPKVKLLRREGEDRWFTKLNLSGTWQDTESQNWAALYSQIRFTVIDECIDNDGLYS